MAHHKVRSHHWNNGILSVRVTLFELLEEALEYVNSLECHSAKIYDHEERVVSVVAGNFPTYA